MSGAACPHGSNSARAISTGLAALIAATFMLFAALTSAYIVRRGLTGDWTSIALPPLVPGATLLLIAACVAFLQAQRRFRLNGSSRFSSVWFVGIVFGLLFVVAQVFAARQLAESGISIASSPAAAFSCVLAGTFAVFVLATAVAALWAGIAASRHERHAVGSRLKAISNYWVFLNLLWLYLLLLLYLRS